MSQPPVDPKTRMFLDVLAQAGESDYATLTAAAVRERAAQGRALIEGPHAPELPVVREDSVAGGAGPLKARVYDVMEGDGRPCLIYFHGGGFVYGDLDSHDGVCRRLARDGEMRVIAVDYRLAPEHPFPAAADDAIAAVRAIAAAPARYGVDPNRLAVGGDSAGGNLAAVAARSSARSGGPRLRMQLLIYPVTQQGDTTGSMIAFAKGYFLTQESMAWYSKQYLGAQFDALDERISPLRRPPPAGLAPAYVVTAGYDPLKDEGAAYAELLNGAGIAATYVDYPDQIHGFFSLPAFSDQALAATAAAAKAVRDALG